MPFDLQNIEYDAALVARGKLLQRDVPSRSFSVYRSVMKRAFDLALIVLFAPVIIPLIAIMAFLVMLDGNAPFYSQQRVGRNGKIFRMLKLRTMVPNADKMLAAYLAANPDAKAEWDATQKLKNDPRITKVGRILRKTSLDELPQLINVLAGSMSIVGPRPMMVEQQRLYDGQSYFKMRPGLTGLWQVSDRNECEFRDRVKFDDAYYQVLSFSTDVAVILRTVRVVLRGTGY